MQTANSCFLKNRVFFFFLLFLVTVMALFTFSVSKEKSFIGLNFFHERNLDAFFIWYTYIGDGLFSLIAIVFLFLVKRRVLAIQIFLAFLLSGIIAQVLKLIFHMPRPIVVLAHEGYHYFIKGITCHGYNSFPSGHTTSAFAMATLICLQVKNGRLQILIILLACGVGYSRIYLGQHFLPDVLAGMVIGVLSALFVYLRTYPMLRLVKLQPVLQLQ